jgi:hypothetical protein
MSLDRLSQDDVIRIRSLISQANESYRAGNYDRAYDLASQAIDQIAKATKAPTAPTMTTITQQTTPAPSRQQDNTLVIIGIIAAVIAVAIALFIISRRR